MSERAYFRCPACSVDVPTEKLNRGMRHRFCGTKVEAIPEAWDSTPLGFYIFAAITAAIVLTAAGILLAITAGPGAGLLFRGTP